VTSTGPLNARSGPGTSYPVVKTYQPGATVAVACQAPGSAVASTKVWDKLTDGTYVTDYYISTPSKAGYSTPITRCRYPYQVSPATTLSERAGPGRSYPVTGELPPAADTPSTEGVAEGFTQLRLMLPAVRCAVGCQPVSGRSG
jgi:uncharacterized protein YraI